MPAELTVTSVPVGEGIEVVVSGELDGSTAPQFESEVIDAHRRATSVTVDLSAVDFMDSSGHRSLIRAHEALGPERFTIVSPSVAVRRILEIASTLHLLGADPTAGDQMEPTPLSMYDQPSSLEPLSWSWAEERLIAGGAYWVASGHGIDPHPRPVWGVWHDGSLLLSIGSPTLQRAIAADPRVVVHLDGCVEVVIVHGRADVDASSATVDAFLAAYREKYDWQYDVAQLGPPTRIAPTEVLAWQSAGWAGRDGFQASGKWTFADQSAGSVTTESEPPNSFSS